MGETIKKIFVKIGKCLKATHKTINVVQRKKFNLRTIILLDLIWCRLRYRIKLKEYVIYEFYNIPGILRKTYVSIKTYESYKRYLYSPSILHILNNKKLLFERLKNYLGREVIDADDASFKDFETFALKHSDFLARKANKSFLTSQKIYHLKDFRSQAFMLDKMKADKNVIVEALFKQDPLLDKISNNLVTIIIITICNPSSRRISIVSACIKFRENETTINGYIDVKSLSVKGHLRDNNNRIYPKDVNGYEIPSLKKAFDLVKVLASELDEIREIEWSICLTDKGEAYLVDANASEDLVFEQTPEYLKNRVGLKPFYKRQLIGLTKYKKEKN